MAVLKARAHSDRDKELKRKRILDSARSLFFDLGYQKTTVGLIMKQARMSTGTFYLYFVNKIEIYKILMDEGIVLLQGMFARELESLELDAKDKLVRLAQTYYRFYHDYPKYFEIIAFVTLNEEELRERESSISHTIDERNLELLGLVKGIIDEGNASGEFYVPRPWVAANILWGWLDGIFLLERRSNLRTVELSLKDLLKDSLDIVLYGLTKLDK